MNNFIIRDNKMSIFDDVTKQIIGNPLVNNVYAKCNEGITFSDMVRDEYAKPFRYFFRSMTEVPKVLYDLLTHIAPFLAKQENLPTLYVFLWPHIYESWPEYLCLPKDDNYISDEILSGERGLGDYITLEVRGKSFGGMFFDLTLYVKSPYTEVVATTFTNTVYNNEIYKIGLRANDLHGLCSLDAWNDDREDLLFKSNLTFNKGKLEQLEVILNKTD